eukprot:1182415-Prorocentrum_minimum.AAC.2
MPHLSYRMYNNTITSFYTGPPVPITARVHSTPQRPLPFSRPVSKYPLSATALPLGPANITLTAPSQLHFALTALPGVTA